MNTKTALFNYIDCIRLTSKDAKSMCHSGSCDNDVANGRQKPYIQKQLDALDPEKLKRELAEYGAWNDAELANHEDNKTRILWIAAGDIVDGK